MEDNFKYLISYLLLWIIAFFVYLQKARKGVLGGALIVFYLFGSVASLWMSQNSLYYSSYLYIRPISSLGPLMYLFVVILLFSTPLFLFNDNEIKKISLANTPDLLSNDKKIIFYFVIAYILASIVTFVNLIPMIMQIQDVMSVDAGTMMKSMVQHENYDIISANKIVRYMYLLWRSLNDIMICMMFYFLANGCKKISFFLFVFCGILPVLWGFSCANRQQALCTIISILLAFIMFRNTLSNEIRKKIFTAAVAVFIPFFLMFYTISVLRFGDQIDVLVFELVRYFGESTLNFSSLLFDYQQHNLWGASSFPQFLGLSLSEVRSLIDGLVGVNGYLFYSFIGNFIMDFGKIITFVFAGVVCLCSLLVRPFVIENGKISLSSVVLCHMWANLCFQGIFFFTYVLNKNALLLTVLFYVLLKFRIKNNA